MMKDRIRQDPSLLDDSGRRPRLSAFLMLGCLLLVVGALLFPRKDRTPVAPSTSTDAPEQTAVSSPDTSARDRLFGRLPNPRSLGEPAPTAEQVVANKLTRF